MCQTFISSLVSDLLGGSQSSQQGTLFSSAVQQPWQSFVSFLKNYMGAMIVLAGEDGTFEGGGGLGFGVNVLDCSNRPVVSFGSGIGFGFSSTNTRASIFPNVTSGLGGGGGILIQSFSGSTPTVLLRLGGGGGGGLLANNGVYTPTFGTSPDPDQVLGSVQAAFAQVQSSACQPLSLDGSGGGGGGFVAFSPVSPVGNMNYGGGTAFGFGAAFNGTQPGGQSGGTNGAAIGRVMSGCRVTCQV